MHAVFGDLASPTAMADLTSIILWVAAVALFWVATPLITKIARRRRAFLGPRQPPVANGVLPVLVTKGPLAMIYEQYTKLGSVFSVSLLGLVKATFLIGPDVSAHFYQALDSEISQDEVCRFTVPTFGPGVGYDVDYATRHEQFRFFGDAMKPAKLRSYVALMVREVEDYFGRWGQSGTVDLSHELQHIVTLNTSRCLLGKEVREKMLDDVSALLHDLIDGMRLITMVFPYLPTPAHRRRDAARARLGQIFSEILRSRKTSGRAEDDMLQCLIDAKYKDGRATTETEIAGMLVSALIAGQHTSSNASTWTGTRLLSHTKFLDIAIEEQKHIMQQHGDRIDYDVLLEMDALYRCIKEALRLHPPSLMLVRHARRGFTVRTREGDVYQIPEGHVVATPLVVNNRLPYIYRDPHVYDPDRFGAGREEDKVGGPFSYTSFGGGRHACIGGSFAYLQIKVIWSHLLRNFELEMVSPLPETDWNVVLPGPKGKVVVRYKRQTR